MHLNEAKRRSRDSVPVVAQAAGGPEKYVLFLPVASAKLDQKGNYI